MTPRVVIVFVLMVCGMRVCTVNVFLLPGSHPPLRTVEEGRSCAVYTVNGQELCTAFIIVADTQKHCCSITSLKEKNTIYYNLAFIFVL